MTAPTTPPTDAERRRPTGRRPLAVGKVLVVMIVAALSRQKLPVPSRLLTMVARLFLRTTVLPAPPAMHAVHSVSPRAGLPR